MGESVTSDRTGVHEQLNITISDNASDTVLCELVGEVDLATAPSLHEKLKAATQAAPHHLVIDLSGVGYLGSAGLKILVDLRADQHTDGRHLAVVTGHNRMVIRPLHATGLDEVLDLHAELTTAMQACIDHPATTLCTETCRARKRNAAS